jgi:predicted RNase H-like HicB family nuclease
MSRMKKHFPVIIEQDRDGVFIVECPVFEGCRSYGNTINEAMDNISEAIEVCLEEEGYGEDEISFIGVRDLEVIVS